jgi:hypothetical protein
VIEPGTAECSVYGDRPGAAFNRNTERNFRIGLVLRDGEDQCLYSRLGKGAAGLVIYGIEISDQEMGQQSSRLDGVRATVCGNEQVGARETVRVKRPV